MRMLALSLIFFVIGCQTTTSNSTQNPNYTNIDIGKVLIFTPSSPEIENNLTQLLSKSNVNAIAGSSIIPFISTAPELSASIRRHNISHIMVVYANVGNAQLTNTGYSVSSNANFKLNTYNNPFAATTLLNSTTNSTITPTYLSSNSATAKFMLIDTSTTDLVWQGNTHISANGILHTDRNSMNTGLAKGILKEMRKGGVIK